MGLNLAGLLLTLLLGSSLAFAESQYSEEFYEIHSIEINEITDDALIFERDEKSLAHTKSNTSTSAEGPGIGKVIAIGKDLVALGESVYSLVSKGKPTNVTSYAPISVIPSENGAPVDIFQTESWSVPVKRTYEIKYYNLYDVAIVHFQFSVMYSYGGTYNGKGAYLTSVQVVPEYVKTLWGWEFSANMKLGGIQNLGTKSNPVAGATVMIEYSVSSVMNAIQRTSSFFVAGNGSLRRL